MELTITKQCFTFLFPSEENQTKAKQSSCYTPARKTNLVLGEKDALYTEDEDRTTAHSAQGQGRTEDNGTAPLEY